MRTFAIHGREGFLFEMEARSDYGALAECARRMGVPAEIEGTYRLRLPGGSCLYAVSAR